MSLDSMQNSDLLHTLGLSGARILTLASIAFLLVTGTAVTISNVWKTSTKRPSRKPMPKSLQTDCPYEYILNIYGRHHFATLGRKLAPELKADDPKKWEMILDIMDGIHFCLILIDDITDKSEFRHGLPAAHTIFGASETSHRAYLSLVRITNRTIREQPQLVPALVRNLEEILEGQDMSLVWRRDGLVSLPPRHEDRMEAYYKSASLKTGALFRLLGQLIFEDSSHDELMTRVGWYCQLQNDCKNVYSKDYAKAKGAFAEDLRNGEFSYPIILALNECNRSAVEIALENPSETHIKKALMVVRSDAVRNACLKELGQIGSTIKGFVEIWGRKETLDV